MLAVVGSCTARHQALAQDDAVALRSDIVIRINNQSTRESSEKNLPVSIGDATGNIFQGDRGIGWSIVESLQKAELTCSLSNRKLSMGEDESNDVIVSYTSAKVQKDKPGQLTLGVSNPQLLQPGFYQGRIDVEFTIPDPEEPIKLKQYWTVTVAVSGRLLESFEFDNAKQNMLRVGVPASVTATIHTIGCDVGTGDLTVEFEKDGSKETALHLPIPLTKALDPLTMLKKEGHTLHPRWFDYVITSKVSETDFKFLDSENLHQAFKVQMRIPACFKPSNLLAKLNWPQSSSAPKEAGESLKGNEILNVKVAGGIHVYPPLCSTGELVTVRAVSSTDLGPSITLIFKGPNGESYESVLMKPSYEDGAPAVGDYFEYLVQFSAPTTGQWKVSWPAGDKNLEKALGTPRTFEAWLENDARELAVPLTVFASATPITWGFFPEPYQGSGWKEIRKQAFVVRVNDQFMKNVRFTPLGIFKVDSATGRLVPYDTKKEPTVSVKPNAKKAGSDNANPTAGENTDGQNKPEQKNSKQPPEVVVQEPMDVPKDGLAFDVVVEVDRENETHPGNEVSVRTFYYRALIEGTGPQGESVQKLIYIPIVINVTTEWEWFKTKIGWTVGVIIFLVVLYLIYRSQNPKLKKVSFDTPKENSDEDSGVFPTPKTNQSEDEAPVDSGSDDGYTESTEDEEEEEEWQGFPDA